MNTYDPKIHHRRSMRLKGYDYSLPGAYFITLVAYQRANLFGEIIDGKMHLSPLGIIAQEEWMRSVEMRREIRLNADEFIVMPNHGHGIVWIIDQGSERGKASGTEKGNIHPLKDPIAVPDGVYPTEAGANPRPHSAKRPPLQRLPRSLSSFIAGYKSAVTGRARRELSLQNIWQRNYYDHIIRNERELEQIWQYIDTNVQNWQDDQLHPSTAENRFNRD